MNDLGFTIPQAEQMGPPRWMLSFADLMSVLLTFFVLLFSMSVPPESQDQKQNDLKNTGDAAFSLKTAPLDTKIKIAKTDQALSTNYISDVIRNRMVDHPELAKANIEADDVKLTISISANEFTDEYAANLADILKSLTNRTSVYSSVIDQSKAVVEKLQQFGLDRNISFYESHDKSGKIDIVIYP